MKNPKLAKNKQTKKALGQFLITYSGGSPACFTELSSALPPPSPLRPPRLWLPSSTAVLEPWPFVLLCFHETKVSATGPALPSHPQWGTAVAFVPGAGVPEWKAHGPEHQAGIGSLPRTVTCPRWFIKLVTWTRLFWQPVLQLSHRRGGIPRLFCILFFFSCQDYKRAKGSTACSLL